MHTRVNVSISAPSSMLHQIEENGRVISLKGAKYNHAPSNGHARKVLAVFAAPNTLGIKILDHLSGRHFPKIFESNNNDQPL